PAQAAQLTRLATRPAGAAAAEGAATRRAARRPASANGHAQADGAARPVRKAAADEDWESF
ncbi:hypothetical protein, partial [Bordetella pseudohinzii]